MENKDDRFMDLFDAVHNSCFKYNKPQFGELTQLLQKGHYN